MLPLPKKFHLRLSLVASTCQDSRWCGSRLQHLRERLLVTVKVLVYVKKCYGPEDKGSSWQCYSVHILKLFSFNISFTSLLRREFCKFSAVKCASLLPFDLKGQLSFLTLTLYCYHVICTELSQLLIINFILSYNQITDYECNNITMLWQINCQCILVLLFYWLGLAFDFSKDIDQMMDLSLTQHLPWRVHINSWANPDPYVRLWT